MQDAYFADKEIILSDLSVREGLKKIYDRVEASYLIINLKFWTIKDQSSNGTIVAINQMFQKMVKMWNVMVHTVLLSVPLDGDQGADGESDVKQITLGHILNSLHVPRVS